MKSAQEGSFRAFLVHSAATHAHLTQSFLVHDARLERGRRPLRWIELFHVVHEIDADGGWRTRIEGAEDPRLAGCGHNFDVRKSRIPSELCHVFGALRIV